jgi:hypothetical protein
MMATPEIEELFRELSGDVIYTYTRKQAIEDGVLVDLTEWASADKGFMGGYTVPVAVTASVWADIKAIPKGNLGDVRGRAHDLLWMSRLALSAAGRRNRSQVHFKVILPIKGKRVRTQVYNVAVSGGDNGEPVVTIMQPGED